MLDTTMILGTNPFLLAFAILPLVSAALHRKSKKSLVVLLLIVGYSIAGWLLLFAAQYWNDMQWVALMERTPNPSEELIQQFNSDGASKAFTLLFGLPVSVIWCSLCWGLWRGISRLVAKSGV